MRVTTVAPYMSAIQTLRNSYYMLYENENKDVLSRFLKVAKGLFYLSKKLISVISVKIVPHMTYNVFGGTLNPTLLLLCNFLT